MIKDITNDIFSLIWLYKGSESDYWSESGISDMDPSKNGVQGVQMAFLKYIFVEILIIWIAYLKQWEGVKGPSALSRSYNKWCKLPQIYKFN